MLQVADSVVRAGLSENSYVTLIPDDSTKTVGDSLLKIASPVPHLVLYFVPVLLAPNGIGLGN